MNRTEQGIDSLSMLIALLSSEKGQICGSTDIAVTTLSILLLFTCYAGRGPRRIVFRMEYREHASTTLRDAHDNVPSSLITMQSCNTPCTRST